MDWKQLMKKNKDNVLYLLLFIMSVLLIIVGSKITSKDAKMFLGQTGVLTDRHIVRVDEILSNVVAESDNGSTAGMTETKIKFVGTIVMGDFKGESIVATYTHDNMYGSMLTPIDLGDWIFVYLQPETSSDYYAGELVRLKFLIPAAIIFFVLLIVFAKFKGLATIVALGLSVLSIFVVFIPAILSGKNIYVWTFIICLYSIMITPFFISGFNKKSVASAFGCIGGVTVAGALTAIMNALMKISGSIDDDTMMVSFILKEPIDLRAIIFSAVIIGALGATLDVSMSISSAMYEMKQVSPDISAKKLTGYGMSIGRDIVGTQISTLVLAYIGGSLSVVLLLVAYQSSVMEMLNLEIVIVELLQALIGAFTILFTIPATALVCGVMFTPKVKE